MKSYQITAANAAGLWRYVGLFACSVDAICHALEQGATRVSVKPLKATP